ncbi:MAG: cardiolipin synthase B [Gammaproteobacteria bacterium]|nr:cardiolipin synthase B [Gammaproteobacteria bacterium]MBU1408279.1 cardiolipin synthase B [Gammaproteobacteria bacterium]MBU1532092.1 cardiolipin synthase B [Gammaproteobacteria bacterium]
MNALATALRTMATCGTFPLAGCTTLPDLAGITPASASDSPARLETAQGPVSPAKNAAILSELKSDAGSGAILQKHLALEEAINRDSPLVLGNRLVLLQDGPATYKAMFAAIRAARDHINLETYIFEDGEVGTEFANLLLKKQAAGVQVNVIYDSVGCIDTPKEFFERMRDAGIRTLEFNPVNPAKGKREEWALNNRDHRKLLVVDGKTAFLGGINISESYSSGSFSRSGKKSGGKPEVGWRDTHLKIDGPVVAEFQKTFMDTWARQKGPPLAKKTYFPRLRVQGDEIVRAISSESGSEERPIYLTLLSAIGHAERNIHLTMGYFVPDPQLREALAAAARRGVDVQIILPGKTDSWVVFHAGRSHYDELLRAGVRIYERRDAVLHSKTATIDGVWSTIGSTNLDWRSFLHNDELNAVILGTEFAQQMAAMFGQDRAASEPIDPRRWQRRSLLLRLQEWLAQRFEYWL